MNLFNPPKIQTLIMSVRLYVLLIISLPVNGQAYLDFFKQPEKQPTTWIDTLPPIFHPQNGYKYYSEWNYITYGWCLVFVIALINTAIVLYRKGFRTQSGYFKYQMIWKISAILLSLLTFYLWGIGSLPTSTSTEYYFSPFLFFLVAFIFPGILLLITVSPIIIQRYYQVKRSAS